MKLRPREAIVLALIDAGYLREGEFHDGEVAFWVGDGNAASPEMRDLPARLRAVLRLDAPARALRTGSGKS